MRVDTASVGARGADSLQAITPDQARALAGTVDFSVRYLGSIDQEELRALLAASLAFMPVTFADQFDPDIALTHLRTLGLPSGVTVWLDVEGKSVWDMATPMLIGKIDHWADRLQAEGFMPGIYIGSPQPLTSEELYALRVVRYWRGQGRIVDRTGALAEPHCGWCMTQMYPSVTWRGVLVDANIIGQDYLGRVPAWVRA